MITLITHPDNLHTLRTALNQSGTTNYQIQTNTYLDKQTKTGFILHPDGSKALKEPAWHWKSFNSSHLPSLLALGLVKEESHIAIYQFNPPPPQNLAGNTAATSASMPYQAPRQHFQPPHFPTALSATTTAQTAKRVSLQSLLTATHSP